MKKIILALFIFVSVSAFAKTQKIVCGVGMNTSETYLINAVNSAEKELNKKLASYSNIISTSAPTLQTLPNPKFRNFDVTICTTIVLK